jgi:putative DNA primase/helicase
MISAAELKHQIPDAGAVAGDLYGIAFRNGMARCPFPNNHAHGDRDPSLRHDRKKNRLFCASQGCLTSTGVDSIGLVQRMDHCSFPEAIQKLVNHYGIRNGGARQDSARHDATPRGDTPDKSRPEEKPIPADSVRQGLSRRGFRAVAEFEYSANLRKVRFEHESSRQDDKDRPEKTFRWEHLADGIWYSGDGDIPRPLYVNRVFRERDQVGLVVGFEGEAKADLAGKLGLAAFSFKNITLEQAAALADCDVVLWRDNDASGKGQADSAAQVILDAAQTRSLRLLAPPVEFPIAADIIEAVNDLNWDRALIVQFLETAVPFADGGPPLRPDSSEAWVKPEPLQSDLPPVEPFHEDLLPASFRPLVVDVTERMQVPMDFAAVVMVLCLAGTVNRRAVIQPKAHDHGWVVVPILWGGIVAPPGLMKSPVIQAGKRPLDQIESEWRREHEEGLKDYALAVEEWELRKSAWKQLSTAQFKKGNAPPERPVEPPPEPILRRLIVNDATFEAMHQTMSENLAGIFVIRDELTGWWSTLDRAGREGERAFCLQAWNGDTGHTIDRIGRGTIHVPACCMSMLGGIQPGRLRSYLVDAIKDGPGNDGLIQRFQLLVWPDTSTDWTYVDRAPNAAAEQQAARVFRRLLELDTDRPAVFRFEPAAQKLFIEWLEELEAKVRGDELHPALVSHLSKYRSLMPSLALLFELADRAGLDGSVGPSLADRESFVSLEHTRQAASWCEYLESHARRVYSCVVTPQLRAARELADHIKKKHARNKNGGFDWFAARDVYLKGWTGLDTPEAVKAAAEVLEDAGWVREMSSEPGVAGGRPSNRYCVNPRVWE